MNEAPKSDAPSGDVSFKASIAALIGYALVMGVTGVYYALQCGSHWFMYIISFSLFAVPVMLVIYGAFVLLLNSFPSGQLRYWFLALALAAVFFAGCFIYAHLQPAMPFNVSADCVPF